MAAVILNLDDFLEKRKLSRYQLAKELDNYAVGRSTAYAIAAGQNQPTLKTVGAIIAALRAITGEKVELWDVLEYVEDDSKVNYRVTKSPKDKE